jgi:hypothetical protein
MGLVWALCGPWVFGVRMIRGRGVGRRELGFRPEHYLILSERAAWRRRSVCRGRFSPQPRRHRSPPRACRKVARSVGGESGGGGVRGSCRRWAMTTARGRSASAMMAARAHPTNNTIYIFCFVSFRQHCFFVFYIRKLLVFLFGSIFMCYVSFVLSPGFLLFSWGNCNRFFQCFDGSA